MNLMTLIIQIILTIPLTIILNYFQNKDNRRINQILIPTIYIIIISALLPIVKENIFLIVIFEIFIRNFYITNVTNRNNEISNIMFIIESIVSVALSLLTYNYFISQIDTVIPDPETIKGFVWFLIILYATSLYKMCSQDKKVKEKSNKIIRKQEQIIMQYAKYKNKYASIVKSKLDIINNITYAIMIYNNYKTPKIYRNIKEYIGAVTKKETPYGIMQIKSYTHLTDEESIKTTINDFEHMLKNTKLKEEEQIAKMLKKYDEETSSDIKNIYNSITAFQKK